MDNKLQSKLLARYIWTNWGLNKFVKEVNEHLADGWFPVGFNTIHRKFRMLALCELVKGDMEEQKMGFIRK